MLGVTDNRAKLWVDCQPVKSVDGYIESPLRQRGEYDINEGFLSIVQNVDNRRNYQVRIACYFLKLFDVIFFVNFFCSHHQ